MDGLNGPVILIKRVDADKVTFHRKPGQEGIYVDYRLCADHACRYSLFGIGFTISGDELRLLQPPAPTAQAAGELREIANGLERRLTKARENGESRIPTHYVEDTRNRLRAIAASLVPAPAELPKEDAARAETEREQ